MFAARCFALGSISPRHLVAAACVAVLLSCALNGVEISWWRLPARPDINAESSQRAARATVPAKRLAAVRDRLPVASGSLAAIELRWDGIWRADAVAAELNVGNLRDAPLLIARAGHGDLEAVIDLIAAATWCLSAGPLGNVTDLVNDERRPCYERFGDDLASREHLQRASFAWLMELANAGVGDAVLYASALTRGIGHDLLGGRDGDAEIRVVQRALLLGQLQSMAERGSADAASELHGHWSGESLLGVADTALAAHYFRLTSALDPARTAIAAQ